MFFMKNPSPLATGIMYWAIVTLMGLGLGIWVLMAEALQLDIGDVAAASADRHDLCHDRQGLPDHGFGLRRAVAVRLHHQARPVGHRLVRHDGAVGRAALSLLNFILPPSSMFEWIIMGAVFALSAVPDRG